MGKKVVADVLHQNWVHSHEEDTATEMVFRPAAYNFPRSRGRNSFALNPDGSLVEGGSGPTDRRQEAQGTWKLENEDHLAFYLSSQEEPDRVLSIASADAERLVIKK